MPPSYSSVSPAALTIKDALVPSVNGPVKLDVQNSSVEKEYPWLNKVRKLVGKEQNMPSLQ